MTERPTVVDTYLDGTAAMTGYKELHRQEPGREFYVIHTDREALDITELPWFGIRPALGSGLPATEEHAVPA